MTAKAYWQSVQQHGAPVPSDRPLDQMTAELVVLLGDPDPCIRSDIGLQILSTWVHRGVYDDVLNGLGDGIVSALDDRRNDDASGLAVLRRSYSAALLADVISRNHEVDVVSASALLSWGDAAAHWFVHETDLRQWTTEVGRIDAIGHGADVIDALARSRHIGPDMVMALLEVIGDRLVTPTDYAWRHDEDDRLACATMTALRRGPLEASFIDAWLARLSTALRPLPTRGHSHAEWPHATAHNVSAFLRALYLHLSLAGPDDPPERSDLLLAVLETLRGSTSTGTDL